MSRVDSKRSWQGGALALVAALALSCGGGGGGGRGVFTETDDLGGDGDSAVPLIDFSVGPVDMAKSTRDLAGLIPEPCGNSTCAVGQKCCFFASSAACMDSCPDGSASLACELPQDCGGNPCCLTVVDGQPTTLTCTNSMDACQPMFDSSQSGQTRFCNVDADCTNGAQGTEFDTCCSGNFMGQPGKICFDKSLAALAGLTCP